MKASNWAAAADVLFEGAVALLRAGQGGSGGDLGCFLVDVFGKAGWRVEEGGCRGLLVYVWLCFAEIYPRVGGWEGRGDSERE